MLLQGRTKDLQLQKAKSIIVTPTEREKCHGDRSSKQTAITIREPPPANIRENTSCKSHTSIGSSEKEKQILQHFCVFEKGSTSNRCEEGQNVTPTYRALAKALNSGPDTSGSTSNRCEERQNVAPKVVTTRENLTGSIREKLTMPNDIVEGTHAARELGGPKRGMRTDVGEGNLVA